MNWLLICVSVLFFVCMVVGFIRGAIKIAASLVATIVIFIIVSVVSPYMGKALVEFTPIDDFIKEECIGLLTESIAENMDLSKITVGGMTLEDVKELQKLKGEEAYELLQEIEVPKDTQIQLIEKSEFPQFFKDLLLENNNNEMYRDLKVSTFPEYVGEYVSGKAVQAIAFIITLLVATVIVRLAIYALGIIGDLPVINGINRGIGAALGSITALIIVWVFFVVVAAIYSSAFGQMCMEWINDSSVLTFLFDKNIILKWAMKI